MEDAEQWYVQPAGREGRPKLVQALPWVVEVAVGSGMEIYVVEAVPSDVLGESTW